MAGCDILTKIKGVKKKLSGNTVSHSNRKNRRTFKLGLQKASFKVGDRVIRLRVSCKGLRWINKKGIEHFLPELKAQGII